MSFLVGFLFGVAIGTVFATIAFSIGQKEQYTQGYIDALQDIRDGLNKDGR